MIKTIVFTVSVVLSANALSLSESEFINRIIDVHPFFKQLEDTKDISTIDRKATTANQDWTLSIDGKYKDENVYNIDSVTTYDNLDTTSIDFSAKRQFNNSGADVVLKHSWKEKNKDLNNTRNKFSVDYTLPLLKNLDGINDRLNTDLADIDIKISNIDTLEKKENFVLKYLQKFIELAYLQEQNDINNQRVDLAKQELKLVEDKFSQSVVDKVDVLNQQDAYQRALTQQLQAKQELELMRYELSLVLNLDKHSIRSNIDLYKLFDTGIVNIKQYIISNSRVLKIADLKIDKLNRQLKSNKNKSLADLDLSLGLTTEGEKPTYSESIENQSASYTLGLELSYPIGGIESSSAIQKNQSQINQAIEYKDEQLVDLHAKSKVSYEKIKLLSSMLKLSKEQVKIAKARTAEEKRRYANGNSQASFVINAQDNEMSSKLNYTKVAKNYQQAARDYLSSIDKLIQ